MTQVYKDSLLQELAKFKEAMLVHIPLKNLLPEVRVIITLVDAVQALLLDKKTKD